MKKEKAKTTYGAIRRRAAVNDEMPLANTGIANGQTGRRADRRGLKRQPDVPYIEVRIAAK